MEDNMCRYCQDKDPEQINKHGIDGVYCGIGPEDNGKWYMYLTSYTKINDNYERIPHWKLDKQAHLFINNQILQIKYCPWCGRKL
jgi:hypothetical protein